MLPDIDTKGAGWFLAIFFAVILICFLLYRLFRKYPRFSRQISKSSKDGGPVNDDNTREPFPLNSILEELKLDWKINPSTMECGATFDQSNLFEIYRKMLYTNMVCRAYVITTNPQLFQQLLYSFNADDISFVPANLLSESSVDKHWYTDTEAFGMLLNRFREMMILSLVKRRGYEFLYDKRKEIWSKAMIMVDKFMEKLPTVPEDYVVPIPPNWYQFSISFPMFLLCIVYLGVDYFPSGKAPSKVIEYLGDYGQYYYQEVDADMVKNNDCGLRSIGWCRSGSNVIMMGLVKMGTDLLAARFDANSQSQLYVRNFIRFQEPSQGTGNGVYDDGTIIEHSSLRGCGYYANSDSFFDILSFVRFYGSKYTKFLNIWQAMQHPTVPYVFGALFSRTGRMYAPHNFLGQLGFHVFSHGRIVTAKMPNWIVQFFCQSLTLYHYEADQTNFIYVQHWLMNRTIMHNRMPVAEITKENIPYITGIFSYGNETEILKTPPQYKTTYGYYPMEATSAVVMSHNYPQDTAALEMQKSSVGGQGHGPIGLINYYRCKTGLTNQVIVAELMLITEAGYHVHYTSWPDTQRAISKPYRFAVALGVQRSILHNWDGKIQRHIVSAPPRKGEKEEEEEEEEGGSEKEEEDDDRFTVQMGSIVSVIYRNRLSDGLLERDKITLQRVDRAGSKNLNLNSIRYKFNTSQDISDNSMEYCTIAMSQAFHKDSIHTFHNDIMEPPTGACIETDRYRLWLTFAQLSTEEDDDDDEEEDVSSPSLAWLKMLRGLNQDKERQEMYKSCYIFLLDKLTRRCWVSVDMGPARARIIRLDRNRIASQFQEYTLVNGLEKGKYIQSFVDSQATYQLQLENCTTSFH